MTLLFVLALHLTSGRSCRDLCNADAVRGYSSLLARSAFGHAVEFAAWVVKEKDGRLRFVWWSTGEDVRASFRGSVPVNAIAIAHTHPAGDFYPSPRDVAEARRIHMPILVITVGAITVAGADGTVEMLENGRDWRVSRR